MFDPWFTHTVHLPVLYAFHIEQVSQSELLHLGDSHDHFKASIHFRILTLHNANHHEKQGNNESLRDTCSSILGAICQVNLRCLPKQRHIYAILVFQS